MKFRSLGSSSLEVSVLAFGAWQLADFAYWGDSKKPEEAVRAAMDLGINLFDVAESYADGDSERVLGRALGRDRHKVLVATKVNMEHCEPAALKTACENSLQRLRTDHIDLYQVHWPNRHVHFRETYKAMLQLRQEGKVREIGVSNFGRDDLKAWMNVGTAVSNQLGYNLLFRPIEEEIIPECMKLQVGILVYMPLLQGVLTGRWRTADEIPQSRRRTRHFSSRREGTRHGEEGCETLTIETLQQIQEVADRLGRPMADVAIAWLLAREGVASVLVGGNKRQQIERNIAAMDFNLGPDMINRLDEITQPLKERFGVNADLWEGTAQSRVR